MYKIPLIKPYITVETKNKVCEVLDSNYITEGKITRELEENIKEYVNCNFSIAVTSCTTGLELALRVLKIGKGDEVIVPDYTFPATASVVSIVGADIILVDINKDTMLINYDSIRKAITKKTKAILPVSQFGNPLDYRELNKIKEEYNLYIIEDAACSLGSEYNGIKTGSLADISVFSFHPRKFITTGEGGIITTNKKELADWMTSYKHFGQGETNSRLDSMFDIIGTNYKLSDVLSAIGVVQMKYIKELLQKRIDLATNYMNLLREYDFIKIPTVTQLGKHSYQSFCVLIDNRDNVLRKMREEGIEVQIGTYALHRHKAFKDCRRIGNLLNSNYVFDKCLVLPLYNDLTYNDQEYIVDTLIKKVQ